MRARYLVDKSALARMPLEPVRRRLAPIIEAGEAATCGVIDLEILYSARSYDEHAEIRDGDFETIAEVTGQPVEWVVERGSV